MEWNFDNVKYNGKDLDRVQVDGVTVWEKAKPKFYDYLQSVNGSAFINTGIIANDNTKIEFNAWSNCTGSFYFTGSRLGGTASKIFFAVGGKQANKDITLYVGDTDTAINLTRVNTGFSINGWLQTNGNTTFSYYLNYENQTFTDNNVPYSGSISYTIPIYIFSLDTARTISQTTRLYSYKIWQNGVLVRDFIPCEYKGEYGLWDLVNNKFYGNDNSSGAFTVGSEIEYYDYLENDGVAYIDTDYCLTSNNVRCLWCTQDYGTTGSSLFGAEQTSNNKYTFILYEVSNKRKLFIGNSTSLDVNYTFGTSNDNWELVTNNNKVSLSNNNTLLSTVNYNSELNKAISIALFGNKRISQFVQGAHLKLYYWKLYDNGVLVRDYKPCLYNNQAGLWDAVECKFYGNANNTGTLTVGNE